MKRIVLTTLIVAVMLLSLAAIAIPRPVAAQVKGAYLDEIIFSIIDQDLAIASLEAGDTDVYIFPLDRPEDKQRALDSALIDTFSAATGINDMLVNPVPHGAGVTGFNPFTIREVREALNWAIDRDLIINDIQGGFAIPYVAHFFRNQPDWARDPGFFFGLENKYAFDPQRAFDQVEAAMLQAPDVTWDSANNRWLYLGQPINLNLVQRVEDLRFEMGAYVGTVLEDLGFQVTLNPSTGLEAFFTVYAGDPEAGAWHIYTEGWGFGALSQFDDGQCNFFYNGDFGSAIWDFYEPPVELQAVSVPLERAEYASLAERLEWMRTCSELGLQDGIRVFMIGPLDVMAWNANQISDLSFDLLGGTNNYWALRTAQKGGTVGGTAQVTQPVHTVSGWNQWAGFTWIYEEYQRKLFMDCTACLHPHLGTGIAFRATFDTVTVGPTGVMDVPETALWFNTTSMMWEEVGPDLTSASYSDLTYTWGAWHHGEPYTMDDVVASLAMRARLMEGDLEVAGPSYASEPGNAFYHALLKGVEFDETNDTIRFWFDFWNPDETVIGPFASWGAEMPWETNVLQTETALDGTTDLHETDATAAGTDQTDMVKGPTLAFLDTILAAMSPTAKPTATGFSEIPNYEGITDLEAADRWAAIAQWKTDRGHYMVSNGPYYVDSVSTAPEGTVLKADRVNYPFDVDRWDFLTEIREPTITIGPVPDVIQTFPATFTFSTTFQGAAYDQIARAAYLVTDPVTRAVLFEGDATRVGAGQFEVVLGAEQTTALVEGTYVFTVVVSGTEAASPGLAAATFATKNLNTVIIEDITTVIDNKFAEIGDTLTEQTTNIDAAAAAANSALTLTYVVLGVAVVAIVIGLVVLVLLVRRLPPRT